MSPAQEEPACMVDRSPREAPRPAPHFGLDKGITLPLSWLSTGTFCSDGNVPSLCHLLYLPLPTWDYGELDTASDQARPDIYIHGSKKAPKAPTSLMESRPGLPSPSQRSGTWIPSGLFPRPPGGGLRVRQGAEDIPGHHGPSATTPAPLIPREAAGRKAAGRPWPAAAHL